MMIADLQIAVQFELFDFEIDFLEKELEKL